MVTITIGQTSIVNGLGQRVFKAVPQAVSTVYTDQAANASPPSTAAMRLPHHSRVPSETMLIVNQPGRLAEIYTMKGQLEEHQEPTLNAYYYHNDHLGTPQVMTDGEQKVVWKASYDAFGWRILVSMR